MFKKTTDFAILATKNQICAIKDVLYRISYETVGIGNLPEGLPGGQVNLESVMAWSIWRIRLSETQCFVNGLPWVLPIFLGDLAQTDKLSGPDEIPTRLKISDATYQLGGITFWNRVSYIGRL